MLRGLDDLGPYFEKENKMNLFLNLDKTHADRLENLKANTLFVRSLVNDLNSAYNVVLRETRTSETKIEIVAYPLSQVDRYGWGFTFLATPEGVSFQDGRGIRLSKMFKVLGIVGPSPDDYISYNVENETILQNAAKALNVEVRHVEDRICGDHFKLEIKLSQNDPKLNGKLKLIVSSMLKQGVTTKLF